ncbi:MAG: hypothetical protein N3D11_17015, partial [Candidatus Sumerlaeia bacterium]|nr:hypothetical protein [Candidatus Sumerlaeia bacterium]
MQGRQPAPIDLRTVTGDALLPWLPAVARLRIAVCSAPLLAKRPLHGYGLGSFQYVFPPAQADYFAAHPHTLLAPTPQRTVQA